MDINSVFNDPSYYPDFDAYDEETFDPTVALDEGAKNIVFTIGDGKMLQLNLHDQYFICHRY